MADLNVGIGVRFNNGAQILIGAEGTPGTDVVQLVRKGTMKEKVGGRKLIPRMNGMHRIKPLLGDEQACTVEFDVDYTGSAAVDPDELMALLRGELNDDDEIDQSTATGEVFCFSLLVKQPDFAGALVGQQRFYESCYLPSLDSVDASSGDDDVDHMSLKVESVGPSPQWTRYDDT